MASTNWSTDSVNSTNYSSNFGVTSEVSKPAGSAIGLLLALTHASDVSIDYADYGTNYTKQSTNSTNWS